MSKNEQVLHAIYAAMDEVNPHLPQKLRMNKSMDTALYGQKGTLDSLALVTLIVAIQERVEQDLGVSVNLADDRTLSQENSPFQSVRTLAEYITQLLDETRKP